MVASAILHMGAFAAVAAWPRGGERPRDAIELELVRLPIGADAGAPGDADAGSAGSGDGAPARDPTEPDGARRRSAPRPARATGGRAMPSAADGSGTAPRLDADDRTAPGAVALAPPRRSGDDPVATGDGTPIALPPAAGGPAPFALRQAIDSGGPAAPRPATDDGALDLRRPSADDALAAAPQPTGEAPSPHLDATGAPAPVTAGSSPGAGGTLGGRGRGGIAGAPDGAGSGATATGPGRRGIAGGGDGLRARLAWRTAACYPRAARRRRAEGSVEVRFCTDAAGDPRETRILASSGSALLDEAATECVIRGSAPFPVRETCVTVPIEFRLR